jgi:hypothetical protein
MYAVSRIAEARGVPFLVRHDGQELCRSATPFMSGARKLLESNCSWAARGSVAKGVLRDL